MEKSRTADIRVLVAEDDVANQRLIKLILENSGCIVELAQNGKDAVSMAEKEVYDLILMDCAMPGMDGYEATVEIRKSEIKKGRHTPVVALTAYVMDGAREKCLEAGMDDYMSKPLSEEMLRDAVTRWGKGGREGSRFLEEMEECDIEAAAGPAYTHAIDPLQAGRILELANGDTAAVRGMFSTYISVAEEALASIKTSSGKGDIETFRKAAHTLKGGSGTYGATRLSNVARKLEYLDDADINRGCKGLIEKAEKEFEKVRDEAKSMFDE